MFKNYYCSRCGKHKPRSKYTEVCEYCRDKMNKNGKVITTLFKKIEWTQAICFETEYAKGVYDYVEMHPEKAPEKGGSIWQKIDCEDRRNIKYQEEQYNKEFNKFFDEVIAKNPDFDPAIRKRILEFEQFKAEKFAQKRQKEEEQSAERKKKREAEKAYEATHPKPKCPTCGSTNVEKISTANRMVSVGMLGLASDKIGKQFCCKNCGYKW